MEKKTKTREIIKRIIITILIFIFLGAGGGIFLLYGPISTFRDWWITTAMTTMTHQYLATIFYGPETIKEVLQRNTVEEIEEETNTDLIVAVNDSSNSVMPNVVEYKNEYERQILEKDPENDDYKIIQIKGKGYSGYMAVIYDPSKIEVATSKSIGKTGEYLTKIAQDNNAQIAINAGGFYDEGYSSNGANPLGLTIQHGKTITSNKYAMATGGLIGFTQDNKLYLGRVSATKAKQLQIRDGVTFGPYLIVNGEPAEIKGNGGWGIAPRTAIGQRKDGIVLFLVLDGRLVSRPGATMSDVLEIMKRYDAYNATNLDGGTSSAMVVDGKIINDPVDSEGRHRTRYIPTAFILKK